MRAVAAGSIRASTSGARSKRACRRVDMVVLGGLNEGTWPAQTRLDPLLVAADARGAVARSAGAADRPCRARFRAGARPAGGVADARRPPGRRAARRVALAAAADRLCRRGLAADDAEARRGSPRLGARDSTRPAASDLPKRPRPSPPVELRPKQLSVTRIETLIRDPYAIYARSVLRLRPFEPLGKTPDAAERGTLIHDILEEFVRERPRGPLRPRRGGAAYRDRPRGLRRASRFSRGDRALVAALREDRALVRPHRKRQWTDVADAPRRAHRRDAGRRRISCSPRAPTGSMLWAAAGSRSSTTRPARRRPSKEVRSLSPQLPLEGLIARARRVRGYRSSRAGAHRLLSADRPRRRRRAAGDRTEVKRRDGRPIALAETLATTERRLARARRAFRTARRRTILSNKIPKPRRTYVGDYDHLARISEWVATDQEDEDVVRGG